MKLFLGIDMKTKLFNKSTVGAWCVCYSEEMLQKMLSEILSKVFARNHCLTIGQPASLTLFVLILKK